MVGAAAPNVVGIVVVLPVVLPKAHGADLAPAARVEGQITAAGTGVRTASFRSVYRAGGGDFDVLLEHLNPPLDFLGRRFTSFMNGNDPS